MKKTLYKDIKECNIKLVIIIGLLFVMFSGYTSYALFNDTVLSENVILLGINNKDYSKEFTYTGDCKEYTVPYNGYYKIETWGASGGGSDAGLGGYSSGIIKLLKGETLYMCIGGKGGEKSAVTNIGGFNGGGYSGNNSGGYSYGGGGSTDIRLVGGSWNGEESLNSRIIVSAGGAGSTALTTTTAGSGGGLIGESGTTSNSNFNTSTFLPTGGTQTSGGYAYDDDGAGRTGNFGYASQTNTTGWGGGGGSGYYSGANGHGTTGSGGSSFISGYAGVNAIASKIDRSPTNDTLHYTGKYFISGQMETGINSGNGKIKITYVRPLKPNRVYTFLNDVRYIKDCMNGSNANAFNHFVEVQAIYNGVNIAKNTNVTFLYNLTGVLEKGNTTNITDGLIDASKYEDLGSGNNCVVVDLGSAYDLDEVVVWHYWSGSRTYKDNYTYVSSDNENWTLVIDREEPETSQGKRVNAYENKENIVLTATKKDSNDVVTSNTWSNEGLTFNLSLKNSALVDYYSIYYCKDTTNTCTPSVNISNGDDITNYNSVTGTYYIRYYAVSIDGKTTDIESYIAKVDTDVPVINSVTKTSDESTSITVSVNVTDISGITTYYYQIGSNDVVSSISNTYTFTGLTPGTDYTINIYTKDKAGNISLISTNTFKTNKTYLTEYLINNALSSELFSNETEFRYIGTTPNNYICFGTINKTECTSDTDKYMYRIIGIYKDSNGNNIVKLIKKEALNNSMEWSDGENNDIDFVDSEIYSNINGDSFLSNTTYMPNGWSDKISSAIGIISVNDYYYAYNGEYLNCSSSDNSSTCKSSWMHLSNNDENPSSSREITDSNPTYSWYDNYIIKYINSDGRVVSGSQDGYYSVRPVFYLQTDVGWLSGTGTISDPYIIS